jgi:hypothetical protein
MKKAKSHGRWINGRLDHEYVYVYNERVIGAVNIDYSDSKPLLSPVDNSSNHNYQLAKASDKKIKSESSNDTIKLFLGNEYQ